VEREERGSRNLVKWNGFPRNASLWSPQLNRLTFTKNPKLTAPTFRPSSLPGLHAKIHPGNLSFVSLKLFSSVLVGPLKPLECDHKAKTDEISGTWPQ
uniref:Uncharacterized protein n=1 Tax=Fundulus heteroclitus TaxID=8078 RepID=A0A3Q2Q6D3_FUNHE